ncbi:MAG TPA: hypothetical protein VLE45_15675, partial [Burkholderiaceae bacterium]|nr:hypothetical protein [Burkholderiaceae bacterium]
MPRKTPASPPTRGKAPARQPAARRVKIPGEAPVAAAEPGAELGSAAWPDPSALTAVWTRFAEQMQRANEQAWRGLRHDIEIEAEDVQHAETPQQLAGAPIGLAAEQVARWMQLSNQLATSLLDMQAAWFKEVEAATAQLLAPLVTRNGRIAFGSAQDIVEPPGPNGPMQALWSAQKLWSESAKVWLN